MDLGLVPARGQVVLQAPGLPNLWGGGGWAGQNVAEPMDFEFLVTGRTFRVGPTKRGSVFVVWGGYSKGARISQGYPPVH